MRAPGFWRDDCAAARLLSPLGALYGEIARKRLGREAPRANLPTLIVGGLTAGGDGKTPLAIALAQRLKSAGERPALLTRGYGRKRGEASPFAVDVSRHHAEDVGDEALLLARVAPTIVGADRIAGAALAQRLGATVVILDDGFHSRRIASDLTLIAVDADYGAGNRRCMPAGPLRAPLDAQLAAADLLVVIGDGARGREIAARANKPIVAAHLTPDPDAVAAIRGVRVVAFAGIARPEKFFDVLEKCGAEVTARISFDDHRRFTERDYATLSKLRQAHGARLVTTEKDAVRMGDRLATLDHAAFGRNRPNADDVIDSKSLERALREKPDAAFSQRALGVETLPVTLAFDDVAVLDQALRGLRDSNGEKAWRFSA